nr:hypothetical protein [Tanacetum cinerariifolium]
MTSNISYLFVYEPYDGGYVSFGKGGGKITGKGIIKTGKLEFENVYFVKDLKYNLFSVSQICDNKNSVLFTDSECIVLGRDFKLKDDTNGKQPKASCKTKLVNLVSKPLHTFHMDLFRCSSVSSLNHKWYCLVVTDDFPRCDNMGEFKNREMNEFCTRKGIKRVFSNARIPQQNGVAERRNMSLIKAAKTILADAKLPVTFWAEAVNTTCYVQNKVLVNKSQNKTPYHLGKFDAKGDKCYFIGYSMYSKAFRVFNKRTNRVEENLHVDFLENKLIKKGVGPNWLFDIDTLTNSMNYVPVVVTGTSSTNLSGNAQDTCNADAPESSGNFNPTATSTNPPADHGDIKSGICNSHWVRPIGTKRVLKNKKDERGIVIKNKARLVAQGHTQEEGIYYEEVFTPLTRIKAIRLFLAYASFIGFTVYHMDVKSAFLYGTIDEEVYVMQPPGFQDSEFPDRVYKVEKAMYGLHQAPKACNLITARLAFYDYHKMIAVLEKSENNFWSTARIETTNEGTKILATVDGKPRTNSESSIRRNLKLNDENGLCLNLQKINQKPDNIYTRSEAIKKSRIRKQFFIKESHSEVQFIKNPKKQTTNVVELEFRTIVEMADNRTMVQMLQAPIEGYEDTIVVPQINANNFELKPTLINLVQSNQFTGRQDPHNHLRFFNKVTSTFRHPEVPNTTIKLLLFPFLLEGEARIWLDKEPSRSILTWEDLVSKFINQFFPPSKTRYLRNEITNFLQKPNETFNEAWERFKICSCNVLTMAFLRGNFLDKIPRECLSIIKSKSKVRYSRSRVTDVRANTNAPLSSSSSLNSFDLQQIVTSLEDKLDIRMNRFKKSLNDMKNSFITPTTPLKAFKE